MAGVILCTRRDFERARSIVLRALQEAEDGVVSRRQLSNYRILGVTYEAIEVAIRYLQDQGIVEELYTLPKPTGMSGVRKVYFALTTSLDAKAVKFPEDAIRVRDAFRLIADLEVAR